MFMMLCAVYLVVTVLFRYEDTVSFTAWSVNFWDCLFSKGGLSSYYAYSMENIRGAYHDAPQGSWLTFFPWILWNFPVWLLNLQPVDVTGTIYLIWAKILLLICIFVMCRFIYKIVLKITEDNNKAILAALFNLASLEILDSAAYAGQDEVIYLTIFLGYLSFRMDGKRLAALIAAVVSITLCPIMIIPYIIGELCLTGNIFQLIINCVIAVIPSGIFEAAYRKDVHYAELKDFNTIGIFQTMMNTFSIETGFGKVCIPAVLLVVIAGYCFIRNTSGENGKDKAIFTIQALALSFLCLSFGMHAIFYRYCLYVPFFVLLVFTKKLNIKVNMLLLMAVGAARFLISLVNDYNFNTRYMNATAARLLGNSAEKGHLVNSMGLGFDTSLYMLRAISWGLVLLLLWLCIFCKEEKREISLSEKTIVLMQTIIPVAVLVWWCIFCIM